MRVHVYFLIGLLELFSMCLQANRGTRGGVTRRIPRRITQRQDTNECQNKYLNCSRHLIELTPTASDGNAVCSGNYLTSKQQQKTADSLDTCENAYPYTRKNLIYVDCTDRVSNKSHFSISLVNCQSIKNKSDIIADIIINSRPSLMFLTETWMYPDDNDWHMEDATPSGYSQLHRPRPSGMRGGGVGVIFQNGIRCADITAEFKCYASFELLAIETNLDGLRVSYYLIYRPPPSASNNIKKTHFITDFSDFLETIASRPGHFCILGDFNIPWDKINDSERKGVASLLAALGLSQHVSDPTHNRGHTIDYIITKSDDNILTTLEVGELVSDHHLINAFLDFAKPDFETKVISYRKIKAIDTVSFSNDILAADLLPDTCDNIAEAIETYNNELKRILDKHAPIKRSKITLRPKQP